MAMARKTAKTPDEAAALSNPRLRPQVVGNGGLYFAAYRLSKMGWNVMPTSRNARGVDILAYDMHTQNYLGIQVKALSKRNNVPLGRSIDRDRFMQNWWIIVIKIALHRGGGLRPPSAKWRRLLHRSAHARAL
jgi:hypothetical protein